jgi:hypothetical protein
MIVELAVTRGMGSSFDKLCDILKRNLIGVVLTYNFILRKYELLNLESCVGAFLLRALCLMYLVITFTYHLFTAHAENQP